MITYNDIYESLRKEKYSEQLQPLAKNFIKEVAEYLEDKKKVQDKKGDMFNDIITKTKKQLENAVSIFKELMMRRKKKLLTLAFIARETGISKKDFENMTDFEKNMFDKIIKSMEEADNKLASLIEGKQDKKKNLLINFKQDVEEFLGLEGEMIGPFEKGQMANLSGEIVDILVEAGKAEIVEEE